MKILYHQYGQNRKVSIKKLNDDMCKKSAPWTGVLTILNQYQNGKHLKSYKQQCKVWLSSSNEVEITFFRKTFESIQIKRSIWLKNWMAEANKTAEILKPCSLKTLYCVNLWFSKSIKQLWYESLKITLFDLHVCGCLNCVITFLKTFHRHCGFLSCKIWGQSTIKLVLSIMAST